MKKIKELLEFSHKIGERVEIESQGEEAVNAYLNKYDKPEVSFDDRIIEFQEDHGIKLEKGETYLFFISTYSMKWSRGETKPNEGYLAGGFAFNALGNVCSRNFKFWEKSLKRFLDYEQDSKVDMELLNRLRWVESPTSAHQAIDASYTPYFGCVEFKKDVLPDTFYFYDSGITYELPFHSYDEYISALMNSSAVECWQYFYVDPNVIIKKNKGLKYITWTIGTSKLNESMSDFEFHPEIPYDRLDLIAEYLERCIRLLPSTFPFLNFNHHKAHYEKFKKLYDASKS